MTTIVLQPFIPARPWGFDAYVGADKLNAPLGAPDLSAYPAIIGPPGADGSGGGGGGVSDGDKGDIVVSGSGASWAFDSSVVTTFARTMLDDANAGAVRTTLGVEPAIAAGITAQYWRGDKSWQTLNKAAVGLGNVDNTADNAKAVASADTLTTARSINGVSFNGSANITINAVDSTARVPEARTLTTSAPLTGGGDLSANRTLAISAATTGAPGSMSAADKVKLDGVATAATANSSDATLLARANHTGSQAASTISDFAEVARDTIGATLVAGSNVTITVNDGADTITIAASGGGGGGGLSDGDYGDITVGGTGTTLTVDANAITFAKMQDVATARLLGRVTAASGDIEELTAATARTLLNVADGATANSSDAALLARANHTGTQASSTISDFAEAVDDRVGALLAGSNGITATYNDAGNAETLSLTDNARDVTATIILDGGGAAITAGVKGDLEIPFAGTILGWTILADQSGAAVIDIWKDTYANAPPVVGDSITASAKPTLAAATKAQSSTLTGWTTGITAGDILRFNVDSATAVTRLTLSLKIRKT